MPSCSCFFDPFLRPAFDGAWSSASSRPIGATFTSQTPPGCWFDQLGGCVSMPNSGTAPGPCTERPRIGARRMSIDGRREPCGTALAPPARAGVANEIVRFGAPP